MVLDISSTPVPLLLSRISQSYIQTTVIMIQNSVEAALKSKTLLLPIATPVLPPTPLPTPHVFEKIHRDGVITLWVTFAIILAIALIFLFLA
ncbi:hypothetical protein F5884DRAFT_851306 [Xylogone sp. PMI_703]|nr:hypothetical protein F5884DRAFT_851306 [Xylogone sp. PMI_703]